MGWNLRARSGYKSSNEKMILAYRRYKCDIGKEPDKIYEKK